MTDPEPAEYNPSDDPKGIGTTIAVCVVIGLFALGLLASWLGGLI